jgi:hypothetical protein
VIDSDELDTRFTYHPPTPEQVPLYEATREVARGMADFINETCPDGREKSLAMTHLDEVVFWTNAGIARRS